MATDTAAGWDRPPWPFVRVECWRCEERGWRCNWQATWAWCRCGHRVLRLRYVEDFRATMEAIRVR